MAVEISKELLEEDWDKINLNYSSGQGERNQKRLSILLEESEQLEHKDKSLLGDINKQTFNMEGFGGFPAYTGLDIEIKDINPEKVVSNINEAPIKIEAIKTKEEGIKRASKKEIEQAIINKSGGVLRIKYPEDPVVQGIEHGSFAETLIEENPSLAPILIPAVAAAIPLYHAVKLTEVGRKLVAFSDVPATETNIEQIKGGFEGVGRGLTKYLSKEFFDFVGITTDEKKPNTD